jgi:LacI family transcriptional regulator
VSNIICNDKEGAYKATKYLIDKGHEKIALISGKKGFRSSKERKEGYIKALLENNILLNENLIKEGHYDTESGYEAMNSLLKEELIPTAVFCCNDDMALGAYKAIFENKKRVGADISVFGFDDNIFSEYANPPLTTVKRPIEKVSIEGAKVLLDIIREKRIKENTIYIDTEVIIRGSVKEI